jgi:D-arabinose 1-dehydrogenase-like Zn-dependent alcohol dehydrogenase
VGSTPSRVVGFDGGYAEYMLAPIEHLVALPDEIGLAEAAPLPCAGLTTYTGFRKAALAPGQRTVGIGVGGPGHLAISIGAAFGGRVYAVTSSRNKVQDALERGAAFAGSAEDVARRLHDDGGAEVVLNTVDDLGPLATIMTEVAIGAKIVLAAAADAPLPIDALQFLTHQLQVFGTFFGSPGDLEELLALAVTHGIRPQIEGYRVEDVNQAQDNLRNNKVRYRAVVEF